MKTRLVVLFVATVFCAFPRPVPAGARTWFIPPIDGQITQRFDPPAHEYGSGHRGIDLAASPGTAVRAVAPGVVFFAGDVGHVSAVTVVHGQGLVSTYSDLAEVLVRTGQRVGQGTWIGRTDTAHGELGLHLGVKLRGEYVDPEQFLGPVDLSRAIHLIPEDAPRGSKDGEAVCEAPAPLGRAAAPPNGNIAVALAGIGSKTRDGVSADMYRYGPEFLGYSPGSIYRFSYRGTTPGGLGHIPYDRADSWGGIREAAEILGDDLRKIAALHPGKHVDLIAHSQGGIVARTFLALQAASFDPGLPPIDHLVTFSSPHKGAPGAGAIGPVSSAVLGRLAVTGLSMAADLGAPFPDPLSPSMAELAPGSELMDELGRESLLFGTRALALGIPFDTIVPADRAELPEGEYRVVPPHGVENHSGIVASPIARRLAYEFLRDADLPCAGGWDTWGRRAGILIGGLEWGMGRAIGGPAWIASLLTTSPIAEPLLP
ncbi:MAG: peptidoglycan DD-metalloendopeptidase family protein [Actinobacteria bacterium]|nr:peptidoglycan DD-metalloendopeptidase family protein [Actinomycetota bacterium]